MSLVRVKLVTVVDSIGPRDCFITCNTFTYD